MSSCPLFHHVSIVGSLVVFIPTLFLYFLQVHPYVYFIFTENFTLVVNASLNKIVFLASTDKTG